MTSSSTGSTGSATSVTVRVTETSTVSSVTGALILEADGATVHLIGSSEALDHLGRGCAAATWDSGDNPEIARLRGLLGDALDAFDECTGDYPKELTEGEPWRVEAEALRAPVLTLAASEGATSDD